MNFLQLLKILEIAGETALYTRLPAGSPESRVRQIHDIGGIYAPTPRLVPTCWSPRCAR